MKRLIAVALFVLIAAPAHALDSQLVANARRIATDLMELRIVPMEDKAQPTTYAITLNGNVIMKTGGEKHNDDFHFHGTPLPEVILHLSKGLPPFAEVFVFQQHGWDAACENGPIWFLGVKADGSHAVSTAVQRCGGPPPSLTVTPTKVTLTLPSGKAKKGKKALAEEVWTYADGALTRAGKGTKR